MKLLALFVIPKKVVTAKDPSEKIKLKKVLGLLDGVCFIVGVIVGSGIFVSPNITLKHAGSMGMALIIWVLSGMIAMIGAFCYIELGTMIQKSGGDYAYINEICGPLPAFLYVWINFFILVPAGTVVTAITFATNILQPSLPCGAPTMSVRLIAALLICFLTFVNCCNVKWVTKIQDIFTSSKLLALLLIFCSAVYFLSTNTTKNLANPMEGTNTSLSGIALAIYSCLFSYSGWNSLNIVVEELKDPCKTLPRAIFISIPTVILIYVMTNFSYFSVLTRNEFIHSDAVVVTYSEKLSSVLTYMMPLLVAASCFGSLNGSTFTSSRIFFVAARNGHFIKACSYIDVLRLTPVPALVITCIMKLAFLCIDVERLLIATMFMESFFIATSISGLLWLRYKKPDLERPYRVSLFYPILFLCICLYLIVFTFYAKPVDSLVGVCMFLAGIPIYYLTVGNAFKPRWLNRAYDVFNISCAKLFISTPEK